MDTLDVLSQLRQKRVSLHMVDLGGDVATNGISKLVFTILSAVAEAERDRIRERIQDVKSDQKARGRYLGGSRPFGWDIGSDGGMIPREDEQAALRTMRPKPLNRGPQSRNRNRCQGYAAKPDGGKCKLL